MPSAFLFVIFAVSVAAATLPSGTILSIQLRSELSSRRSKVGDAVSAVLAAAVPSDEQILLPAGLLVTGTVRTVVPNHGSQPARVLVIFDGIRKPEGRAVTLSSAVEAIDNARETVEQDGTIRGLRPIRVEPSKAEDLLMIAAYAHPFILASVEGVRLLRKEMENPSIHFQMGADFTLRLTAPLELGELAGFVPPNYGALVAPSVFEQLVAKLPLRTKAGGRDSDQTNLLFVGSLDNLDAAFAAGGWTHAKPRGVGSDLRTFLAMFEDRGYLAAPVSTLTLNGSNPDLVLEKQTNTFSQRHHIRLWKQPEMFEGNSVWLAAATHDVGIDFSRESRSFTHRVEPNVDRERAKILDDLRLAGFVGRFSFVPRASAKTQFTNATGDHLTTDGRLAVVVLNRPSR